MVLNWGRSLVGGIGEVFIDLECDQRVGDYRSTIMRWLVAYIGSMANCSGKSRWSHIQSLL